MRSISACRGKLLGAVSLFIVYNDARNQFTQYFVAQREGGLLLNWLTIGVKQAFRSMVSLHPIGQTDSNIPRIMYVLVEKYLLLWRPIDLFRIVG